MELRSAEHNIRDMLVLYQALRKSTAVNPKLAGLPEVISAMEVVVSDPEVVSSNNMQSLQQVVEALDQIKCKTMELEPSMNKFRKRLTEVRVNKVSARFSRHFAVALPMSDSPKHAFFHSK
jgi:uracil phosphoribosyltransferase